MQAPGKTDDVLVDTLVVFTNDLRQLRTEHGVSYGMITDTTGITRSTLSDFFNAKYLISLDGLKGTLKLCRVTGQSWKEWITRWQRLREAIDRERNERYANPLPLYPDRPVDIAGLVRGALAEYDGSLEGAVIEITVKVEIKPPSD